MLLFFIIISVPVALALLFVTSLNRSFKRSIDYEFSMASAHRVADVVTDGFWTAGIDLRSRTIVVVGSNGGGFRFTYDHVASVELTPIYEYHDTGTSTTTTNRGSQLVSAGVGAMIAGPAGLIVGGLSGSNTAAHHNISTAKLDRVELKIRFYFDEMPIVKISAPRYALDNAERLAAHLANVIDLRTATPKCSNRPERVETPLMTRGQIQLKADAPAQRGWWARTFGA